MEHDDLALERVSSGVKKHEPASRSFPENTTDLPRRNTTGNTVDYLLSAKRDRKAAKRFLSRAIRSNDEPVKINIDKSGANTAGINDYNDDEGTDIEIRQNKYLNNIIEQDHRPIKQLCRAALGFGRFRTAKITIGGFESMRIIRKRQLKAEGNTSAEIFYSLAA
ncbi:MAG TPA: DDE-type integrase/transposase/recombinase [Oligoflexus sp.]|uniref:DDE-type integrase/transposase/recombinase n=1 Tax=Oligoflexus sp. TaxID=1971216 RepID=UPI002D32327A|nr:DDE-type integrase/transposase/recombinase [Oligoflexus sp.]HYX39706.1 DDE-type integrase/transposase/recombinase [Oligoflexus sp.]